MNQLPLLQPKEATMLDFVKVKLAFLLKLEQQRNLERTTK